MDHSPTGARLEALGRLTPAQVAAVKKLVDEATDVDGVRPLSEHVMLHLRYGGDAPARNLLVWQGDSQLAAYAHLDVTDPVEGPSAELVVAPQFRRSGLGRALISTALDQTGGRLRLWAHGGRPEASLMAERLGFRRVRTLLQLRRSLLLPLPDVHLPGGVTVRIFRPGADDEAWLALNGRSFADHPEQGTWTFRDLHERMAEDWFDPAGFFLAEQSGSLVGFHWTKVHGKRPHSDSSAGIDGPPSALDHGHDAIGEVYVLGVDPTAQRLGLGRELTVIGLQYLQSLGLQQVMLYVDESNIAAIRLYESLGFTQWDRDVLFRHD